MSRRILRSASPLVHLGVFCIICTLLPTTAMAQVRQLPANSAQNEGLQLRPPRVQLPSNIQYSSWRKLCFQGSDGATLCRTTSTGTEDTGDVVVRVDLIERVGADAARLQLFVPQGLNLTMGVTATVDQAAPTKFPYNFCLTNICIAADHVSSKLIGELESGQMLKIEQAGFNSSTITLDIPLNQFAAAHKGRQQRLTTLTLMRYCAESTNVVTDVGLTLLRFVVDSL